jgi:bifunctional DNase/RNase
LSTVRLEILGLSASHSQSGSFALVLGEKNGMKRRLPIIIGMFEAQAIAIEMEKIVSNRPMTHDLFKSFATSFGIEVTQVLINNLKEGVFYAKLICVQDDHFVELDARPSDAIAIGIRFGIPIFAEEDILAEAGIEFSEMDAPGDMGEDKDLSASEPAKPKATNKSVSTMQLGELEQRMEEAIKAENYEEAAKYRDEINRRKQNQ